MAVGIIDVDHGIGQYLRSFFAALPDVYNLVKEVHFFGSGRPDQRREADSSLGRLRHQLFAAAMTHIQFVMSLRSMRQVMNHHCSTYSITPGSCPPRVW